MNILKPIIRIIFTRSDVSLTEISLDSLADYKLKEGDQIATVTDNGEPVAVIEVLRQSDDLLVVLESEIVIAIDGFFLSMGSRSIRSGLRAARLFKPAVCPSEAGQLRCGKQAARIRMWLVNWRLPMRRISLLQFSVLLGGLHWQL